MERTLIAFSCVLSSFERSLRAWSRFFCSFFASVAIIFSTWRISGSSAVVPLDFDPPNRPITLAYSSSGCKV